MKQVISDRSSGILLHVSSLPGPFGIGDLRHALEFIDFLAAAGQSYWQVLPLSPTSDVFGNSPYMSYSAFAGNPLFISPETLREQGLVDEHDLQLNSSSKYYVEFEKVNAFKFDILGKAWNRFKSLPEKTPFLEFCHHESSWLNDHALFMALKRKFNQAPWYEWPDDLRSSNKKSLLLAMHQLEESVNYFRFEQYLFFRQWQNLHDYARKQGIQIIGDLPYYVGTDSVDVWANQNIFELDQRTRLPVSIAGVPPDYFSATGQLWGNPLYRWNTRKGEVKKQLYDWWQRRFSTIYSLVDIIRIDHFRGFESYWSVPANDETAEYGKWKRGPGAVFFNEMENRLGFLPIIAEDLGMITPAVVRLRKDLGFPGMKILLFAFDGHNDNIYLPFNYERNCIAYTGTHDNDTAVGWYMDPDVSRESKLQLKRTANKTDDEAGTVHRDLIYLAMSSTAKLCIFPMQDILGFGNDCRMNKPATGKGNWIWRCAPEYINDEIAHWLRDEAIFYNRTKRENDPADDLQPQKK
ncbi:MAG: 4-alpha-glucanotransferase [Desulfobulbaceae bacterium]|nr:4-alpha-glucanotransferase [Desulfobulbaceae bacterium]